MSDVSQVRTEPAVSAGVLVTATAREAGKRVYLDHQASTPMDPAALSRMKQVAEEHYANPASAHRAGKSAKSVIERAREQLADAVRALPEEIVFTSGATESNNIAILGVARAAVERGDSRRTIVTLAVEHPSVLEPARHLSQLGFTVQLAPVARDGQVLLDELSKLLTDDVLLISIQAANNEIGTIQPLSEAVGLARRHGILVHCDAAQALGKIPFDVEYLDFDFASLSAHKCYGPKGVGALFVRGGVRTAPIAPITFGGGHERGLRPGTLNTPAIAAFGDAATHAVANLPADAPRLNRLRNELEASLLERISGARINGAIETRLPNCTSITVPGIDADALVANLRDLDLSTASACHAGTPEPSHVLRAIGLTQDDAYATLRLALCHSTTIAELDVITRAIADAACRLREAR